MTQYTKHVLAGPIQKKKRNRDMETQTDRQIHIHHIALSRGHPQAKMNFQDPN